MSVGLGHGVDMCKDKDLGIWSENQFWGMGIHAWTCSIFASNANSPVLPCL